MSTRVFESAGQRIDAIGLVAEEVEINGAVKDKLLADAKTGAYDGDISTMLLEKNGISLMMEEEFSRGNLDSVLVAEKLLEKLQASLRNGDLLAGLSNFTEDALGIDGLSDKMREQPAAPALQAMMDKYTEITVTYKDDDLMPWNDDGEGVAVPLTDDLLTKIINGDISNANINMGLTEVVVEDGRVTNVIDGLEDIIPKSVMDDAAKFAVNEHKAVTVVPFSTDAEQGAGIQYMYVDDNGGIIGLPRAVGPDGGVVHIDPNAPTHNSTGGTPDRVIGSNDGAPHVDNKVAPQKPEINLKGDFEPSAKGQSGENLKDKPIIEVTPFQLSYESGVKIEDSKLTTELQEKMLRLAELDQTLKIDVGSKDGKADGMYGPKTRGSVMEVEKYLGLDAETGVTGVADNNLMASIDSRIAELELAAAPKVGQEQEKAVEDQLILSGQSNAMGNMA